MNTLTVNNVTYSMRPIDPLLVIEDTGRLGDLFSAVIAGAKELPADPAVLLAALGAKLTAQFKTPDFLVVVKRIFEHMAFDDGTGKREFSANAPGWQLHFMTRKRELAEVIAWGIMEQYADFFGGARAGVTKSLVSLRASAD